MDRLGVVFVVHFRVSFTQFCFASIASSITAKGAKVLSIINCYMKTIVSMCLNQCEYMTSENAFSFVELA